MADEGKELNIVSTGLGADEKSKVEKLDRPIWEKFAQAGVTDRPICTGFGVGDERTLKFVGATGNVVGNVSSQQFLQASDADAVAAITM